MSDRETRPNPGRDQEEGRDAIARLLQLAGPRPKAPLPTRERVRRAARGQWRAEVARRRRSRMVVRTAAVIGLAAGLVLAFGLAPRVEWIDADQPAVQVARLGAMTGQVDAATDDGRTSSLRPGDQVSSGVWLETGDESRAALDLVSGGSLRLDRATRIRFDAADSLLLEQGALYFDSATRSGEAEPLAVQTELGEVRDIGTQFEVRTGQALRVRVREGRVNLASGERIYEAGAGIELRLSASGELSRRTVPIFGPEWDWVLDVARPFALDGRPLDSFLDWVSRETGWELRYVDPALAESAPTVRLHGSIAGLRPDEALEAVLPTCGLTHRFDGGTLLIETETR